VCVCVRVRVRVRAPPAAGQRGKLCAEPYFPAFPVPTDANASTPSRHLSRRDRTLLVLGLFAWIVLIGAGTWFVQRLHAMRAHCQDALESPTAPQASNGATPGNGLRTLTLPTMCK